jgi:CheY-like chemotaxis protein
MCILVVEDEPLIRMILVEDLVDAGFEVREAASGDEAFHLLKTIHPPLQVLVTDIHMPGQRDGLVLGAHVRQTQPHVAVIYTTGRPDALQALAHLDGKQFLIRKPYTSDVIVTQLRNIIGSIQ